MGAGFRYDSPITELISGGKLEENVFPLSLTKVLLFARPQHSLDVETCHPCQPPLCRFAAAHTV